MLKSKSKNFQSINLQNLLTISKILSKIEHFICYGTLLGMTRDNKIIPGDDDVDLLINYKYKNRVLKKMISNKSFKINKKVSNKFFVQYIKDDISITSYVDFYFYINKPKNNYIIEKHNFLSNFKDPKFAIHFPKKFIFPIKKDKYYKIVSLPKKPEMMCQFLYGVEWNTPLKKNISYRMEIVDNKPLLIKRSFLGSLTRWFKTKLSIN